jgi:hypothetical protein
MPTGYTAELMEKGMSFEKFTLLCARAFGALVTMRDDPMDAPIPEKFEPYTYTKERLEAAKSKLAGLQAMDADVQLSFGTLKKVEELKYHEEAMRKDAEQNARLEEMERQVGAWNPPSLEHQGLRDFMLQQIATSKNDSDYHTKQIERINREQPISFYRGAVKSAEWDLENSTKSDKEEIERTEKRNLWVKQLRESLKPTSTTPTTEGTQENAN